MVQEFLVYFILTGTGAYIIYMAYKKFKIKRASPCNGCSGCSLKKSGTGNFGNVNEFTRHVPVK